MFQIYTQEKPAKIQYAPTEADCVVRALQDLQKDIVRAGGRNPVLMGELPVKPCGRILAGCLENPQFTEYLEKTGICVPQIRGLWEHYTIMTVKNGEDALLIAGSDVRGTMFGIYEFSRRFLDTDPMYLWTEYQQEKKTERTVPEITIVDGAESFRFRGWFINDEDLLEGFSRGGVPEHDYRFHRDYGPALEMIAETALRLKQNLIIPCSHLDIMKPEEEALIPIITRRGLFVSMHHQEPVGVHHFTVDRYWKERGMDEVNYFDDREKFQQVWEKYIQKWSAHENVIWQLGLRGRGDRPVWYNASTIPTSVEERGKLISDAIAIQKKMIRRANPDRELFSTSTLWMEGMELYNAGVLKFPEETKVIFADFGPTQMWGEGYDTMLREPGRDYGLYYHVGFWGCGPHLIQGNPPEKIYFNYRQAMEKGDCSYSVLNVSNFREFLYTIPCAAEITWNIHRFDVDRYRWDWCTREFRTERPDKLEAVYRSYYDSFPVMQQDRFPREMMLMDGMCRRVALKLITIIQGRPFTQEDIQNKRLYQFDCAGDFIHYYKQMTQEGISSFEAHLGKALDALDYVAPDRKEFYIQNMLVHTETILGLYRWVHHLCLAAEIQNKEESTYTAHLDAAIQALERIVTYRQSACSGKWKHWYDGDLLMDIPGCIEQTRCLYPDRIGTLQTVEILQSKY